MRLSGALALTLVLALGLVLPWSVQGAQAPPNPVSDAVRSRAGRELAHLVAAAELMPADKYGFRPTPEQMTFGQLVVHVVQTNVFICAIIGGIPPPMTGQQLQALSDTQPKAELVAEIQRSKQYCDESLDGVTDAGLGEEPSVFGQAMGMTRAAAMITIVADWADHYATAATYLRLNGLVPPSATPRP